MCSVDFKPKLIGKGEDFYILTKGTIHKENVTAVYMYATNIGVPSFINKYH